MKEGGKKKKADTETDRPESSGWFYGFLAQSRSKKLVQPCETSHEKAKYKITPKEIHGCRICV